MRLHRVGVVPQVDRMAGVIKVVVEGWVAALRLRALAGKAGMGVVIEVEVRYGSVI